MIEKLSEKIWSELMWKTGVNVLEIETIDIPAGTIFRVECLEAPRCLIEVTNRILGKAKIVTETMFGDHHLKTCVLPSVLKPGQLLSIAEENLEILWIEVIYIPIPVLQKVLKQKNRRRKK